MKQGMQVQAGDSFGTVSAVRPDGSVRVVWRRHHLAPSRARMRVWYDAETAVKFLKVVDRTLKQV